MVQQSHLEFCLLDSVSQIIASLVVILCFQGLIKKESQVIKAYIHIHTTFKDDYGT